LSEKLFVFKQGKSKGGGGGRINSVGKKAFRRRKRDQIDRKKKKKKFPLESEVASNWRGSPAIREKLIRRKNADTAEMKATVKRGGRER